MFTQPFIQEQIKENIQALRYWPLCGEFTGPRWIPRKWSVTRKMFPFDDVIMFAIISWHANGPTSFSARVPDSEELRIDIG